METYNVVKWNHLFTFSSLKYFGGIGIGLTTKAEEIMGANIPILYVV